MKTTNTIMMNKKLFLTGLMAMSLLPTAWAQTKSAILVMRAQNKYQYIDGFGGTGMDAAWGDVYTQEKVNKLWGTGEGQMGLNIMRIRINPNESGWGEYGNPIKWARKVNPNLQVFATPWTPPKKYKTSKTEKYQNDYGTWVWPLVEHAWGGQGSNGGAINPKYYTAYADFLERYRETMEQKGCPIDMISIQNESDYTPTATDDGVEHASYESCIYSPSEMAAMVKAAREKIDPKCKVMGPECFGWGQHSYNKKLLTMQDAVDNIDVWGNHLYGTNDWSFVENVTSQTGKHMWMTEFLIDYDDDYTGKFSAEYSMIESIEKALSAGYNAYVYYSMTHHFFATNHGGSKTELWKRAYVFGHYAKYATGKTRIQSVLTDKNSGLLGGSSYISESGDTVTLFILNKSTNIYNLTVALPFKPQKVEQIATNDYVNRLVKDVSSKYANSAQKVKLSLQPGTFYTFQFIQNVDETSEEPLATSAKSTTNSNPISADKFMADPTSIVYNGRLYVYGTNDQQQFDATDGLSANNYSKITSLVCMSTEDMVNWTDHGTIDVKAIAPWIYTSWAPSITSRVESDGKTHFYLYFTNSATGIGVLTSTSPTGPWKDPLGKALIDRNTDGIGNISQVIDPGVAMNDDGTEAYLTFGGGDVIGTDLQPGNARIVKLGDDMISLGSDIKKISAPCQFEANELNYIGGKWVYSYCTRWGISSEWSNNYSTTAPSAASIVYMVADEPLADNWTYRGVILPNPGYLGYGGSNNHSHLQKFNGNYYMLYHTTWLEKQKGLDGGYRNIQINKQAVTESNQKIYPLTSTSASIKGVTQSTSMRVNPYEQQSGAMAAIKTSNWWMVKGVDFSQEGAPAKAITMRVKGKGTIDVTTSSITNEPIATINFDTDKVEEITVPLSSELSSLVFYLYFIQRENQDAEVLSWKFVSTGSTVEDVNGDGVVDTQDALGIYEYMQSQSSETTSTVYDVNGDGAVDTQDVLKIYDYIKSK